MFSTSGGYHEYVGGGGGGMHVRDILSTSGDVQYIGGYHDAYGDIMSISEDVQYIGFSI